MQFKQILFGLLILGAVLSQSSNSNDPIWDTKDNTANDGQWSTTTGLEGYGLNDGTTECANNDPLFTEITGTTTINGNTATEVHCWEILEVQDCFDEFGQLDDVNYDAANPLGDVRNDCRVREVNGEKYFDFLLTYIDDYEHTDNCARQEINFIEHDPSSTYVPGTSDPDTDTRQRINVPHSSVGNPYVQDTNNNNEYPHDVWFWNDSSNQITFTIDFEDLVDEWLCDYTETTDVNGNEIYQWICDIELNIYFSGEIQYVFEFQVVTTLDRTVSDTLDVTVQRNVVVGECCENVLDVSSTLFFCTNFFCTDNDGNGDPITPLPDHSNKSFEGDGSPGWIEITPGNWKKQVERRQIFYVAHRIDTAEFQDNYFLQPISLHLGPFVPLIHNWKQTAHPDTGNTSRALSNILLYKVESFVALDNLTITSVALLDDRVSQQNGSLTDTDGNFDQPDGYGGYDFNDGNWDANARRARRVRRSMEETVGEDYKIKAEGEMSVVEPGTIQAQQQQQDKQDVDSSVILSLGLSLFLVFALL